MEIYEIIGGAVLILISIIIVVLCIAQGQKDQGMTSAITGAQNNDSFYGKNSSRSKEARLAKTTKILAIIFFVIVLALNVIPTFIK